MLNSDNKPNELEQQKNMDTLENTHPDVLFSNSFQNQNNHLQSSFREFFKKNYFEVSSVQEVTYSTNHVTYYFFKNEKNNDIRVIRSESGCFHSNERFASLESIEKHLNSIKEDKEKSLNNALDKDIGRIVDYFDQKIHSLDKVFTVYQQLKNSTTNVIKPKI